MKTIALIAHNEKKNELLEWTKQHRKYCGITSYRYFQYCPVNNSLLGIQVKPFGHGPSGGDILLAAKILKGKVHKVIFFIDSENPHGHEHDIQTLIRTAVINNVPIALNRGFRQLYYSGTRRTTALP